MANLTARNFSNDPIVQAQVTEAEYINTYQAKREEKAFHEHSPLLAILKQEETMHGKEMEFLYKLSNAATVSAGYVHAKSTVGASKKIALKAVKLYAYTDVDGETMTIFKKDPESVIASFAERFLDQPVQAFRQNLERQIMCNDIAGTGLLGTVTAISGAGSVGSPYVATLQANELEEKFKVGMVLHKNDQGNDGADTIGALTLKVVAVTPATGATNLRISLVGAPTGGLVVNDTLYMASSKNNELVGLRGLLLADAGDTVYGTTLDAQMASTKVDVSGFTDPSISSRIVRDALTKIKRKCGEYPDLIMTSDEIYRDLEEIMDGSKTFFIPWDSKTKQGVIPIGFNGVEFIINGKIIRVVASEFVRTNEVFLLNTKHMVLKWRPDGKPKWDDIDGNVFRTTTGVDAFDARYKAYGQFMANVGFMGIITGVTTTALLSEPA